MKIMICGKGGCGKSTVTALLAKTLERQGKNVLVVDADESNLCLHRLLGIAQPEIMMDAMGGRQGTRERLKQAADHTHEDELFKDEILIDDLPEQCITEAGGIKLLVIGKITSFGEGCACMIGGISKAVLSRLKERKDEIVLIDAEAGLEHFGRRVDSTCDLILCIVDPSFESIHMAQRTTNLADEAGVQAHFVLNKVEKELVETVAAEFDQGKIIASLPMNRELFMKSLKGEALDSPLPELEAVCSFIDNFRKPLTLNVKM